MGADGHIAIVPASEVREKYPDSDDLLKYVDHVYLHELGGVEYYHIYWGDNLWSSPWDAEETLEYLRSMEDDQKEQLRKRLQEFLDWFYGVSTHWEVWT